MQTGRQLGSNIERQGVVGRQSGWQTGQQAGRQVDRQTGDGQQVGI